MNSSTSRFQASSLALLLICLCVLGVACNRDPNYAKQQYIQSGNKYFDRGRYKEAQIMYRKALAKDPKFGEAYYRLALTYDKTGQNGNLVAPLRRAIELLPKGSSEWNDAALRLGQLLVQGAIAEDTPGQNKPLMDEVTQLQAGLDAKSPDSFEAYRLKGEMKRAEAAQALHLRDMDGLKKDLLESIGWFRKSLQVKPNDTQASIALARALSLNGDYAEAEQLYRGLIDRDKGFSEGYVELYRLYAAQKRPADAEALLKQAIAANPKQFSFRTLLASFYFSQNNRAEMTRVLDDMKGNFKDFPQAYLTAGDFYARIGDFDTALQQYRDGEQKDSGKKIEYDKRMVEVLMRQGKRDDAFAKAKEILKDNPKDPDARAVKADFLLDQGDASGAITELQEVVTAKPDNFVARFDLGRAHAARGDYQQALQDYQESIRLRPDYLRSRIALVEAKIQTGDFDGALQSVHEVQKMSPNNPGARLLEGVALMGLNQDDQARAILTDLTTRFPKFTQASLEFAELNVKQKNYAAAREAFHKSYAQNPDDLKGLLGEAETWMAQNQPDKAIALMQAEVAAHPERAEILRDLADLKTQAGQYDAAMADYQTLLKKFKENPTSIADTYAQIGQLEVRKGDYGAAIEWLQKANSLAPTRVPLMIYEAQVYEKLGKTKEAQDTYRKALGADPNNGAAMNNLAFSIADTGGNLDDALTLANRAKQRMPNVKEVNDTLGWIYVKKNMGDAAVDILSELTAKTPGNPTFRYHYCMALYEKGDKTGAQRECAAALAEKPAKSEAEGARTLLAKLQ